MLLQIDKEKELAGCNFVKAAMMIVVIMYHSCIVFMGGWGEIFRPVNSSFFWRIAAKVFSTFHIYTFTFVSGYLISVYTKY